MPSPPGTLWRPSGCSERWRGGPPRSPFGRTLSSPIPPTPGQGPPRNHKRYVSTGRRGRAPYLGAATVTPPSPGSEDASSATGPAPPAYSRSFAEQAPPSSSGSPTAHADGRFNAPSQRRCLKLHRRRSLRSLHWPAGLRIPPTARTSLPTVSTLWPPTTGRRYRPWDPSAPTQRLCGRPLATLDGEGARQFARSGPTSAQTQLPTTMSGATPSTTTWRTRQRRKPRSSTPNLRLPRLRSSRPT